MSRWLPVVLRALPIVACLAVVCGARDAQASSGTALGVDLDYTNGINESGVGSGTGGAIRLGYKLDLLVAQITPEIGGGYHTYSGDAAAKLSQGIVGGRLQFGKILEPGLYAHLGYGHLGGDHGLSDSGATLDGGVTLDLTLLPILDLGVHAGYNGLLKNGNYPAFDTYVLGFQGAIIF